MLFTMADIGFAKTEIGGTPIDRCYAVPSLKMWEFKSMVYYRLTMNTNEHNPTTIVSDFSA